MEYETNLYFESHVTIEPVFGRNLEQLKELAKSHGFRVADLIFKKGEGETPTPNQEDSFCTAKSNQYEDIYWKTFEFVEDLTHLGYRVYRYKIENTLLDSRSKDEMGLLLGD